MKDNAVICPPCGESVARATKEGQNKNQGLWPLLPRLTAVFPPQGREMSFGFTLIELLVVVLIVGILAAVAVPQYQVAAAKARYMQLVTLANALRKGQEIYKLANGTFTADIRNLDIVPVGTLVEGANDVIFYSWGSCQIGASGYASCKNTRDGIIYTDLGNVRQCMVKIGENTESFARKICTHVGGEYAFTDSNNLAVYRLP